MIEPMLAVPIEKVSIGDWREWAIEEKFDGHRIMVRVEPRQANGSQGVHAWSRPRQHAGPSGKTMASRMLPTNLIDGFRLLPPGTYDGELLGGETSTDVTRVDLRDRLRFVVFDLVDCLEGSCLKLTYAERREALEFIFQNVQPEGIELAESRRLVSKEDVEDFVARVWSRGGEGGMLKRLKGLYQPGKRSKDVVKVKKVQHEVMEIIGFEAGRGTKVNRGPYAMVKLRSLDGQRETSVKTLDDAELAAFERQAVGEGQHRATGQPGVWQHPAIGRRLQIEFQDWTPKKGYRHPRWDHWEE